MNPSDSMIASPPILEFVEVTTEAAAGYETGLWDISFALNPGGLLMVLLQREQERLPLGDAAEGLVPPEHGTVAFLGEDWQGMSADRAAAQRGKIGRVFEGEEWVSHLEVDENILLAQKHHTQRSEQHIMEEALNFARMFGLPGLPRGRPANVRRLDLRKAQCISAFLGQPLLIILEQPARGMQAELMAPLVNAVHSSRKRGASVIWTTGDLQIWSNPGLRPTLRAKMFGSQMHLMEPQP